MRKLCRDCKKPHTSHRVTCDVCAKIRREYARVRRALHKKPTTRTAFSLDSLNQRIKRLEDLKKSVASELRALKKRRLDFIKNEIDIDRPKGWKMKKRSPDFDKKVIEYLESHTYSETMKKFNISRQTVATIKKEGSNDR